MVFLGCSLCCLKILRDLLVLCWNWALDWGFFNWFAGPVIEITGVMGTALKSDRAKV